MPYRKIAAILRRLDEPPIVNRVPFELFILALTFLTGTLILLRSPPRSIEVFLLPIIIYVWIGCLIVFPVVILYALLMKDRVAGLHLECYLLAPFGLVWAVYPLVVIVYSGDQAIIAAALGVTCSFSCVTTSVLIRRKLRRLGLWKLKIGS